jgi:hypothetical protein
MRDYIHSHKQGIDASTGDEYATLTVFFWSYAEENVETTPTAWDNTGNANAIQQTGRVILRMARQYRFMNDTTLTTNSGVKGYYVSFYVPNNGTSGSSSPPNAVANTVILIS